MRTRSGGDVVVSGSERANGLGLVSTVQFLGGHRDLKMRVCSYRERRVVVSCRSTGEQVVRCLLAAHSRIGMGYMLGLRREDDSFVPEERDGVAVHPRDYFVVAVSCRRDRHADIFGLVRLFFVVVVGRSYHLIHCRSRDHVDVRRPCYFCRCCLRARLYVDVCVIFRVPYRSLCRSVCRRPYRSLRFQVPFQARQC